MKAARSPRLASQRTRAQRARLAGERAGAGGGRLHGDRRRRRSADCAVGPAADDRRCACRTQAPDCSPKTERRPVAGARRNAPIARSNAASTGPTVSGPSPVPTFVRMASDNPYAQPGDPTRSIVRLAQIHRTIARYAAHHHGPEQRSAQQGRRRYANSATARPASRSARAKAANAFGDRFFIRGWPDARRRVRRRDAGSGRQRPRKFLHRAGRDPAWSGVVFRGTRHRRRRHQHRRQEGDDGRRFRIVERPAAYGSRRA